MSQKRTIAVVLTCEHAGNRVPGAYQALFGAHAALLASHRGWDPGALALARVLARGLGAPLMYTDVTRLLVEANRSRGHRELFSRVTRGLGRAEREDILERYYTPHWERVWGLIAARVARGGRVLHVGVHTFTPVLGKVRRNADVGLLYDPRRAGERALCGAWERALRAAAPGLRVRRNYPYRGTADGLTTAMRREFGAGDYLGIELEVNQALAASAGAKEQRAMARAVLNSLGSVVEVMG